MAVKLHSWRVYTHYGGNVKKYMHMHTHYGGPKEPMHLYDCMHTCMYGESVNMADAKPRAGRR